MNHENRFKCHICYEMGAGQEGYHSACLKKLFDSEMLPEFSFSNEEVSSMALEYVKEKRGLPGVQKKLSLSLESTDKKRTHRKRLTIIGYLGGEYILKPPTDDYPFMPEIEDLTMQLADMAKIQVAPHGLIQMKEGGLAYITKRFDRKGKKKIAVEDLCQLSEKLTEHKYRSSNENVAKIIKKYSSFPGDDLLRFFELILFSFIVGNADMHLKNFSMITQFPNKIRMAPSYDLLATKLLIPEKIDPEEAALPLNGKKSNLRKKDFAAFAENLHIPPKVFDYTLSTMIAHKEKWAIKIEQSFLNDELKSSFMKLIEKNSGRLS